MSPRFLIVVHMWVAPGKEAEFDAFEARAAELMAPHGGRIEQAVRIGPGNEPDAPYEVHVVSFPSEAAYTAFADDPAVVRLRGIRGQIITRTDRWFGSPAAG